jgi:hypothetical protein
MAEPLAGVLTAGDMKESARFAATVFNTMTKTPEEGEELAGFYGALRTAATSKTKLQRLRDALVLPDALKAEDARIASTVMASPKWMGGLSLVNILFFTLACVDVARNGWTDTVKCEIAGGAIGLVQVGTYMGTLFKLISSDLATGLGRCCAAVGVFIGAVQTAQAIQAGDTRGAWTNGIATLGAFLLLVSLFTPTMAPLCAMIGGALVLGATIYSIYSSIRYGTSWEDVYDMYRPAPEIWWLHTLDAFRNGDVYKAVSAKKPALADAVNELRDVIRNTDFLLIDASKRAEISSLVGKETSGMIVAPDPEAQHADAIDGPQAAYAT